MFCSAIPTLTNRFGYLPRKGFNLVEETESLTTAHPRGSCSANAMSVCENASRQSNNSAVELVATSALVVELIPTPRCHPDSLGPIRSLRVSVALSSVRHGARRAYSLRRIPPYP